MSRLPGTPRVGKRTSSISCGCRRRSSAKTPVLVQETPSPLRSPWGFGYSPVSFPFPLAFLATLRVGFFKVLMFQYLADLQRCLAEVTRVSMLQVPLVLDLLIQYVLP